MSFTFLGYLHVQPISITFAYIPPILAGCLLGPVQATVLGAVFGLDLSDVTISLVCVVLSQLAWHVYHLPAVENFRLYVDQSVHDSQWDRRLYRAWTIFVLMLVAASAASVIYFAQRIGYMLGQHGLVLTDEMNYDLVHLQIQFLASALSLNLIMALSLMAVYKYLSYREYLGALDGLTGVMGRRMFLNHCQRLQQKSGLTQGWFLFADVDYFKSINDAYGHPAGDQVLIQVARQKPVSCSIGVCRFSFPQDVQALYTQTDDVLYAAKHSGRGRYAISDLTDQGLVPLFPAT